MCGIIGFTGTRKAEPILLEGLKRLEYRGYDSAGLAVESGGAIRTVKTSGSVDHLREKARGEGELRGFCGIAHTRWATHGAPTDFNAHPHMSDDGRFAVVHNGIIENFATLRAELRELGYSFASETDTEVVAHLLEMYYDGDLKRAVMRTVARLEGSYVLGVLCADEPGRLFAVKEAGPLVLGIGVGENYFASDVTALVAHTKNVVYLEDGEMAELTPESVTVFDCTGAEIKKPVSHVVWDIEAAEKGGYEHFMMKEIMEQPRAVKSTVEQRVKTGEVVFEDFEMSSEEAREISRVVITACGSAYHAGVVAKYAIEALCRVPVETALASELRYCDPIIDEKTLLIVVSQSGETADTIAALRECKSRGARTVAVVNVVGSTIARLADHVIYTHAGPEIAVATTKGYTTQLAALYMLAVWLGRRLGKIDDGRNRELIAALRRLPSDIQRAIDLNVNMASFAEERRELGSAFFIGRNMDYAAALEGSLKLKEISYVHSEAYAAGELKHGTIALIDAGSLVIALCCQGRLLDKTVSNIQELKARGASVVAIAPEGCKRVYAEADEVFQVPSGEPLFAAASEIVPLQLFAYHIARAKDCDIDKPRNLAKSVTVE